MSARKIAGRQGSWCSGPHSDGRLSYAEVAEDQRRRLVHFLRHSFVSLLSDDGVPIEQISRRWSERDVGHGAGPPEADPAGRGGRRDGDGPDLPPCVGVVTQIVTQRPPGTTKALAGCSLLSV